MTDLKLLHLALKRTVSPDGSLFICKFFHMKYLLCILIILLSLDIVSQTKYKIYFNDLSESLVYLGEEKCYEDNKTGDKLFYRIHVEINYKETILLRDTVYGLLVRTESIIDIGKSGNSNTLIIDTETGNRILMHDGNEIIIENNSYVLYDITFYAETIFIGKIISIKIVKDRCYYSFNFDSAYNIVKDMNAILCKNFIGRYIGYEKL